MRRKTNRVVLPQALEQHPDGSDAESDRLPPSDDGHGLFDEEFFEEMFEADVRREAKLVEQQQAERQQAERQRTEAQQAERSDSLSSAAGSDISHQREHSHNVRDFTSSFSNTSASSENSADSILGTTTTTTTATSDNKLNVVDEQYFAEAVQLSGDNSIASNKDTGKPEAYRSQFNNSSYEDLGVIDEHYFVSSVDPDESIQTGAVKSSLATNKQTDQLSKLDSEELNYFDQLIVGSGTSESDDVDSLRDENVRNHVYLRSGDITDHKMHKKPIAESFSSSHKLNYPKKQTLDKEKFHVKLKSAAMTTPKSSQTHAENASNTGLTDASNTGLTDDKTGTVGELLQDTQQQNIRLRKNSNKIEFQPRKKQHLRKEGEVEFREEEQSLSSDE